MNQITNIFLDFTEALYQATTIDDMFSALETAVTSMGFDNLSYTYVPRVIAAKHLPVSPVFKISQEYNQQFIDHYAEAGFAKDDFAIKRILAGDLSPINWWEYRKSNVLTHEEITVIQVAREEYKINNGITLPTYTDGESLAGVSVVSSESDQIFSLLYQEKFDYLHRMSFMFSDRVLSRSDFYQMFYHPFINLLSDTEKHVLIGLAKGEHLKVIADQVGRDYKYISNYVVSSLKKKFGAVTRDQLLFEIGANSLDRILLK